MGKTKPSGVRKEAESERSHVASPETDAETLPGKSQPIGDPKINRDGLI